MGGGGAKAADGAKDEESVGTPDMKGIVPGTERTSYASPDGMAAEGGGAEEPVVVCDSAELLFSMPGVSFPRIACFATTMTGCPI